jgi:cytochrome b
MTAFSKAAAVWDLPTRLFHWPIAGLFAFSWYTAETGRMDWHRLSGETILGLLLFRLVWGFAGGSTARFAHFVRGPGTVLAYLRGAKTGPGHNPLGGYSVIALLLVLCTQVGSGLFAVDVDGLESGPLSYLVDFDRGRQAAHIHHLCFNLLLALVGLHILAVLFYLVVRRRNLIGPMLTGRDRTLAAGEEGLRPASPLWLLLAIVVAAGLAWWIAKGAPL